MSQHLIPQTPAGTRVQINSSGAIGTTTGNQRDRAAGGMTRTAHEVKLTTGELRWATFATILEDEVLELEDPQAEPQEEGYLVKAEEAPLGVCLARVLSMTAMPCYTLEEVAVLRRESGMKVRWTFQDGKTRLFDLGEEVYCTR